MTRTSLKRFLALLLVCLLTSLSLASCGSQYDLKGELQSYQSQLGSNDVGAVVVENKYVTYLQAYDYDLATAVARHTPAIDKLTAEPSAPASARRTREAASVANTPNIPQLIDIFCVSDAELYFLYSTHGKIDTGCRYWYIASLNCDTLEITDHYREAFGKATTQEECQTEIYTPYFHDGVSEEYIPFAEKQVGGWYGGGYIVLTDEEKHTLYNITTGEVQNALNTETTLLPLVWSSLYASLKLYSYDFTAEGEMVVASHRDDTTRLITLDSMAEKNRYAQKMADLAQKECWDPSISPIDNFLREIQYKDGQIYLLCNLTDWSGKGYVAVFQYDYVEDAFQYVTYGYCPEQAMACRYIPAVFAN